MSEYKSTKIEKVKRIFFPFYKIRKVLDLVSLEYWLQCRYKKPGTPNSDMSSLPTVQRDPQILIVNECTKIFQSVYGYLNVYSFFPFQRMMGRERER